MTPFVKCVHFPRCVLLCLFTYACLIWQCMSSAEGIGTADVVLPGKHYSGCIAHLFGEETAEQQFFPNYEKNVVFARHRESDALAALGRNDNKLPVYPLLEYLPTSFFFFLARSMDLRYATSLQIVRDGYSWIDGNQLLTPFILHKALLDAATIMFRGMHIFHPAGFDWALCLQNDLAVPVELDVWIYPPLAAGINPHAEFQDVLLVQIQGTLDITVCDRIKLEIPSEESKEPSSVIFSLSDIQNRPCTGYTLKPASILYIPSGFIHYATTPDAEELSLTHAWQISRMGLTFADFLSNIPPFLGAAFPEELAGYFKSVENELEGLNYLIDVETLSKSVDNEDLPQGWIDNVVNKVIHFVELLSSRVDLESMLTFDPQDKKQRTVSSYTILQKMLSVLSTNRTAIEKAVLEVRFRIAAVYLASRSSDMASLDKWKSLNKEEVPSHFTPQTLVYRTKDIRVSLENNHDLIIVNSELLPVPTKEEIEVYKFCLGYYDSRSAASRVFAISDIPLNSFEKQLSLASLLVSVGALVEATAEDVSRLGLYNKTRTRENRNNIDHPGVSSTTKYPVNAFHDKSKTPQSFENTEF